VWKSNNIKYMNCPNCNSENTSKVLWNWWGGIIGALIVNKRKCNNCGCKFKPGINQGKIESNLNNIQNTNIETPKSCPNCKNPVQANNTECEWCGGQII